MDFEKAVEFVLKHEGGYTFNPKDPGGETNFGISKKAYPNLNIKDLTRDQAKEIYRIDYWNPSRAEVMPGFIKLIHFNTAVNCGMAKANEIMKKSKGSLEIYAWFLTLHYITIVKKNPDLKQFIGGWMNRVADVYTESLK